jgi:hypothetical protein
MTLTLDIKPETKEKLARQAAEQGLDLGKYTVSLLEEAADAHPSRRASVHAKNLVELFAPVRGLDIDFERDPDTGRDIEL